MFKEIYDMIVEDNVKNGLKPSMGDAAQINDRDTNIQRGQPHDRNPRPLSIPERPKSSLVEGNELFLVPPRFSSPQLSLAGGPSIPVSQHSLQPSTPYKQPPIIYPKPQGLQTHPQLPNNRTSLVNGTPIEERFSQLRQGKANGTRSEVDRGNGGFVEMPSPTQYTPPSSNGSPSQIHVSISGHGGYPPMKKPSGPREMPQAPQYPPPPAKLPLDVRDVPLPRAPSPAYDPSRSTPAPLHTPPQLNRKRSIIGIDARSEQFPSAIIASRPYQETDGNLYLSKSVEFNGRPNLEFPHTSDILHATAIKAADLYDCLRKENVLVIDVRSRAEYDQGHIYAKSVMCIEPVGLRIGLSAEELEERLVVSPADEVALFERRNEFDLVVYYDEKTSTNHFLSGPPTMAVAPALRALHDTLYEFNAYKPLRRPPVMLIGGLEAWVDLVGPQSLKSSSTAALSRSTRNRNLAHQPGRPIGRVPMASHNSSLEVRKRRLRDYNPLDADEERTWRETARKEEVESPEYDVGQADSDIESVAPHGEEKISPVVHSYEEFLRKFPEPSAIRQSMMSSSPAPPSRPPPSLPNVPSRPPPAVPRPSYGGVSERDSSPLSPTSRQPPSAQPPLYTARAISHYLKLPRTGLINFSVTCYMNATIQCLLATIPLSQFFLDNRWRDYTQKNWKGSNGIMPEIYANLIRSLWRNDVQAVRPTSLRNFCARLNSEWGIDRQQDAKEYLDFLLDCLHEDLNIHWQRAPLQPLTTQEEAVREKMPVRKVSRIEWDRYSHRESSFISSLFAGQHASRLRCTTCHHTSTTYEAFYSISVEIPRSGRGDIYDCLKSYCQEEMLSGDEVWRCSYCKCEREATKQIIITRAPQFLVVHFKRFSASKTESARKVHTPIHFPLHGFNMEPYMLPPASMSADGQDRSVMTGDIIDAAITPPYLYDAYAVMRHIGQSGGGGHYISLVRDAPRGCWRKFDDERVTDFDPNKLKPEQRLQNEQAYLVFYGRSAAK